MLVTNHYGPMLLILGFVNGKQGSLRNVMPDNPEEVNGPPFLRDQSGKVVSYYSIPGQLIVAAEGYTDLRDGVIIMPRNLQIVHQWKEKEGSLYKVVIQDFRLSTAIRRI